MYILGIAVHFPFTNEGLLKRGRNGRNKRKDNAMACYVTGSAEGDARLSASEARAEADELVNLLCQACIQAEAFGFLHQLPVGVQEWWSSHKKIDEMRDAVEMNKAVEEKRVRQVEYRKLKSEFDPD